MRFTRRITKATQAQIKKEFTKFKEKGKATNFRKFQTEFRKQVKGNLIKSNIKKSEAIASKLNITNQNDIAVIRSIAIKGNAGSKATTLRIKKMIRSIKKGQSLVKFFSKDQKQKYKKIKLKLGSGVSVADIVKSLNRSDFYYDYTNDILEYNKTKDKQLGEELSAKQRAYNKAKNEIGVMEALKNKK